VSSGPILQRYERALELTRAMLAAAQRSDWDGLVPLEKERSALIDQLRDLDVDPGRDATARDLKRQLILDIMQYDEQIEVLTQDWMRELREVLSSISAEQKLSRTYGS
jgi:Flagellar protein FliT